MCLQQRSTKMPQPRYDRLRIFPYKCNKIQTNSNPKLEPYIEIDPNKVNIEFDIEFRDEYNDEYIWAFS